MRGFASDVEGLGRRLPSLTAKGGTAEDMRNGILIGVAAGLVSALLFYSAGRGSPLLSTLLVLLTPLPSLLAGLAWGWLPAAAGGLAGAVAMAIGANGIAAVGYFLALGLPAALIAYLAYLSRPNANDPNAREWYPAGRLMASMALYAGALPVLVLPLIGGSYEVLRPPVFELFRGVAARAAELGGRSLSEQNIEALTDLFIRVLPAFLAAYWLAIFTFNAYLAGRIARASGRFGRDWPDLAALEYPRGFPLLVVAALLVAFAFAPGVIGTIGTSFAGGLLFAYLVAGLALLHFIARGRAPWILWFVYAGLLLFGPYAAMAITIAGLLEPALKLRQRLGVSPPST